ncbi:DoxX family protein [Haliangium ochraceum DSM 14365]|uniref:DoxX family protein n=2 Tax=Haliangium ochraceum TaxID=80816 RepID=D0LM87_HALO1|nr:DoxX family protein [Haliangium ochraceum DSM 14365]
MGYSRAPMAMSTPKRVLLWLMAAVYVGAGVMHFLRPEAYAAIMPDYLPWHMALIYLSGVAEIVLGIAVLVPRTRRLAAWGIIALLIAVFPANIHAAVEQVSIAGADPVINWYRLPLQAVFIAWAWWYTRPSAA